MGARRGRRRLLWSFGDQALSSITNFLLTIAVARTVTATDFGAFALVMGAYLLILFAGRGLTSEPFVAMYAGKDNEATSSRGAVDSLAACAVFAVLSATGVGVLALVAPTSSAIYTVFALSLPGVLLQDHLRFVAFADGSPHRAFASDATWLVLQVAGLLTLSLLGLDRVEYFVAVWGAAAALGACVGLFLLGLRPRVKGLLAWLRSARGFWPYYVAENLLLQGVNVVILVAVAHLAGLADAGAIRGAVTLFTPLALLAAGVQSAGVPELTRLAARAPNRVRRIAVVMGVLLGASAAIWTGVLLSLPFGLGESLLGASWERSRELLLFVGVDTMAALFVYGPFMGLRALGMTQGMMTRGVLGLTRTVGAVFGAELAGARGAVTAFAVLAPVQVCVWLVVFLRASKARDDAESWHRRAW